MSEYRMLGGPARTLASILVAGGAVLSPALAQTFELLNLERTIVLPDVIGRIDHLDIDLDGGRLLVAALGNNSLEVIHLRNGRRAARVEHLREPQGVAYVLEAKRLFRSQWRKRPSRRFRRRHDFCYRAHRYARGCR